ncbi:MAG: polysaccharide deacetylase family protein [Candidatus Poribacteria bacterium]
MSTTTVPDRLVVLTFDDGAKSDIETVAPLLKSYGFEATFFITEGLNFLANKEHRLTWDEVRTLHEDGFEIGNHTSDHAAADVQPPDELQADVEAIERRCAEYGIPHPTSFCYPGYRHSPSAVTVLEQMDYRLARRGTAPEYPEGVGRGRVYDPAVDHPLLIPTTAASGPNWRFEDFIEAVEQARDGEVAVLTFHGVPDLDHPWVHTEPALFERCMAHLHGHGYRVIALRDLEPYVHDDARAADPYASIVAG